jgi:hypothetical protein
MFGLKPTTIEIDGGVALQFDPRVGISNIINLALGSVERPTEVRDFTLSDFRQWRSASVLSLGESRSAKIRTLYRKAEQGDLNAPPNSIAIDVILEEFGGLIAKLFPPPKYVKNASVEFAKQLESSGSWSIINVAMPALGRPCPYYQLDAKPLSDLTAIRSFKLKTELSDGDGFNQALADLVMLLDRTAYSSSLVPEAKTYKGRDMKDPLFGPMEVAFWQRQHMIALGTLYAMQGLAFKLALGESLWLKAAELAKTQYVAEAPIIDWYMNLRRSVRDMIPIHPFLQTVVNGYSNVSVITSFGTKSAVMVPTTTRVTAAAGADIADVYSLAATLRVAAISEMMHMSELSQTSQWPKEWLERVVGVKTKHFPREFMLPPQPEQNMFLAIYEWLQVHSDVVSLWPALVSKLGWTSPLAGPATEIDAIAGDYIVTDGDEYSADPRCGLFGLKPIISLGQVKAYPVSPSVEKNWGAGPVISEIVDFAKQGYEGCVAFEWSVITAKGYISTTDPDSAMRRYYIPLGMVMGEEGYELRYIASDTLDSYGQVIADYWNRQSPDGYVKQWYGEPAQSTSKLEAGAYYIRTSWDVQVWGQVATQVRSTFLTSMGEVNVETEISHFAYRPTGWNMRLPMRMSRANGYLWTDELGRFQDSHNFSCTMLYTEGVTLGHSAAALEPYTAIIPVKQPELPDLLGGEAQKPEEMKLQD